MRLVELKLGPSSSAGGTSRERGDGARGDRAVLVADPELDQAQAPASWAAASSRFSPVDAGELGGGGGGDRAVLVAELATVLLVELKHADVGERQRWVDARGSSSAQSTATCALLILASLRER